MAPPPVRGSLLLLVELFALFRSGASISTSFPASHTVSPASAQELLAAETACRSCIALIDEAKANHHKACDGSPCNATSFREVLLVKCSHAMTSSGIEPPVCEPCGGGTYHTGTKSGKPSNVMCEKETNADISLLMASPSAALCSSMAGIGCDVQQVRPPIIHLALGGICCCHPKVDVPPARTAQEHAHFSESRRSMHMMMRD